MDRLQREREEEAVELHGEERPRRARAGRLARVGSAVGNQAVQRLAREAMPETELDEAEAEEAPPPEVQAMEDAGIGAAEVAGLEAVDDLAEDELPG